MSLRSKLGGYVNRVLGVIDAGMYRKSLIDALRERPRMPATQAHEKVPLPAGAALHLRQDHPRLEELRRRYTSLHHPAADSSDWVDVSTTRDIDLQYFRADNSFVW